MSEQFGLELARVDDTVVLVASGEIDLATAPLLRESLAGLDGRVVLDLAKVTFLDSRGIGVLVGQRHRLVEDGGSLVVRDPQEFVRRSLEIVGLGDWIE